MKGLLNSLQTKLMEVFPKDSLRKKPLFVYREGKPVGKIIFKNHLVVAVYDNGKEHVKAKTLAKLRATLEKENEEILHNPLYDINDKHSSTRTDSI